jgi:tRNA (adenine57-N1/adenine58-N1)-methyltransferase
MESIKADESSSISSANSLPERRRGAFVVGEKAQLTDYKMAHKTIVLEKDAETKTKRGVIKHNDIIGETEGRVVNTNSNAPFVVMRPKLSDYVLSMHRGATIIYPKDAFQIVGEGDIFEGARVLECGAGSGAMTLSLLRAVGENGEVVSIEKNPDFSAIAEGNVDQFFDAAPKQWSLVVEDIGEYLLGVGDAYFDRAVFDMLNPWDYLDLLHPKLQPGGVLTCYVTTVTQMSRLSEAVYDSGKWTPPISSETLIRHWNNDGLSVRPKHSMVSHTGFLLTTRAMAKSHPRVHSRKSKGISNTNLLWKDVDSDEITSRLEPQEISQRKLRRIKREIDRVRKIRG